MNVWFLLVGILVVFGVLFNTVGSSETSEPVSAPLGFESTSLGKQVARCDQYSCPDGFDEFNGQCYSFSQVKEKATCVSFNDTPQDLGEIPNLFKLIGYELIAFLGAIREGFL